MSIIGAVSYGVCALAFAFLAGLLLTSWRGGVQGALLTVACLVTAIWAGVVTYALHTGGIPAAAVELLETLRTAFWLGFIALLLAPLRRGNRVLGMLCVLAVTAPAVTVALVAWNAWRVGIPTLGQGIHGVFVVAGLALALLGLVLTEQLYRNLTAERRWAMKFLCLGVGILFAYDLYLYSDALLFRRLDSAAWQARGAVQALAVPLLAVAAARNASWSLQVFVSRHVAFHTTTILGAGCYLMLISVGGYYIRDFGGSWGQFAQIVLIAAAAVALVVVLISGNVRARLRVFLAKHFFSNKYDYREEWLRLTHRLAEENDGLTPYERVVRVAADIVSAPAGAVWRYREDAGFVPCGSWRLELPEEAVVGEDSPLARFLRERKWIIDLAEFRGRPERYGDLALPGWLAGLNQAWAVIPLLQQETLTGFLLLTRPGTDTEITWEDRDLLKTLGRQIASYLGQHESAQALSQARQFEAFNQLTAFLMHDLKNLIAQQSLVVRNAEKHKHNPEFVDDAMLTIGNSVRRMERLLEHLQRRQSRGVVERVDVERLLADVVRRCSDRAPQPTLHCDANAVVVEADPDEFAMVMVHIVRNAQDATPADGGVTIRAAYADGQLDIEVADTGTGMSAEFIRDELFRPFHTTKSSKGMGIGAHQAREFVRGLGGRVTVQSEPGAGTRFRLALPARMAERPAPQMKMGATGPS
jgi:putative PEP-CTERM system histidine kinase